jgi:hypothetical protein
MYSVLRELRGAVSRVLVMNELMLDTISEAWPCARGPGIPALLLVSAVLGCPGCVDDNRCNIWMFVSSILDSVAALPSTT